MTEDELILTHLLKCSRSELYLQALSLSSSQQAQFDAIKHRRRQGEPLQYLLGTANFLGFDFNVDARVLIPRPETELLVEEAVKRLKPFSRTRILDLGTGSGNIPITLAKLMPDAMIVSVDISPGALELARKNAYEHEVEARVLFVEADMTREGSLSWLAEKELFDLVISNPPYIPEERMNSLPLDVRHEPMLALNAGKDGLKFYRDIIKYTPCLLRTGGYLMMEFGDDQADAVEGLILEQGGFIAVEIHRDLAGRNRFVSAQKTA